MYLFIVDIVVMARVPDPDVYLQATHVAVEGARDMYTIVHKLLILALRLFSSMFLSQDTFIAFVRWATKGAIAFSRTFVEFLGL